MHHELSSILRLWEHDCSVDAVRAQATALKAEVDRIDQSMNVLAEELQALGLEKEKHATRQAEIQRELDRYVVRRDRSKELLRGGHSLDFGTVQKQLEQCSAKVDELELMLLEVMEAREQCGARIDQNNGAREAAVASREAAHAHWVSQGGKLRVELEAIWPTRQAAAAELSRDQLVRYEDFRKKTVVPVARISGKTRDSCHVVVANHLRIEVTNGKRLHACRGCRRWLLHHVEIEELDEEAPGA